MPLQDQVRLAAHGILVDEDSEVDEALVTAATYLNQARRPSAASTPELAIAELADRERHSQKLS